MSDFIDYCFGFLLISFGILILVGTWAIVINVKQGVSISASNNAHTVSVLRVHTD